MDVGWDWKSKVIPPCSRRAQRSVMVVEEVKGRSIRRCYHEHLSGPCAIITQPLIVCFSNQTMILFHRGVVEGSFWPYGYTRAAYVTMQPWLHLAAGITHTALNVFQFIFKFFSSQNWWSLNKIKKWHSPIGQWWWRMDQGHILSCTSPAEKPPWNSKRGEA